MNHVLLEAFRHGAWANKTLIAALREAPSAERTRPSYLGPLRTLNHLVSADAASVHLLRGTSPEWTWPKDETSDLDELEARVDRLAALWEEVLAAPLDVEKRLVMGDNDYEFTAATLILQALHLGHTQREHVNRGVGDLLQVARPNLQPYRFAMETGRGRALPGAFPSGPSGS